MEPKPVICCIIIKIKLTNKIATIQSHSNENSSNIYLDTKCQTFLCFLLKIFLLKQNLSLLVFSIHRQPPHAIYTYIYIYSFFKHFIIIPQHPITQIWQKPRKTMNNHYYKMTISLVGCLLLGLMAQISVASVVSTGDFNKDFFVTWSPSHVNTSADGRIRSLKLDQESGIL